MKWREPHPLVPASAVVTVQGRHSIRSRPYAIRHLFRGVNLAGYQDQYMINNILDFQSNDKNELSCFAAPPWLRELLRLYSDHITILSPAYAIPG